MNKTIIDRGQYGMLRHFVCRWPRLVLRVCGLLWNFNVFFCCFRRFSFSHADYLTFIVPKHWSIVQVVTTIQTDVPTFGTAGFGSNSANPSKNNIHNVKNFPEEYVVKLYKIINKLLCNLSFVYFYFEFFRCVPLLTARGILYKSHQEIHSSE